MSQKNNKYDLYTFVAESALAEGEPFQLSCNCGGVITIMPPFQDEYVICARCESTIRMLVIEGDPGYIIGADPDGSPKLIPVQGSSQLHSDKLPTAERDAIKLPTAERDAILARVQAQFQRKDK